MTENNLLAQDDKDNVNLDPNVNYLEQLVGADKKFKSVDDLAKGKADSDNYIKILEARMDALREDYTKARNENVAGAKLQELIDKNEALVKQLTSRDTNPNPNEVNNTPPVDLDKIKSLVSDAVKQEKQTDMQAQNYREVESKLLERYGQNYKTNLKEQAKTLGLSDDEINTMARNNPKLFYKTFDVEAKAGERFQAPPRTSQRSDTFAPRGPDKKTMSYYNDLRKKDPMAWHDPKIAVEMDKMSQLLGSEFYDT